MTLALYSATIESMEDNTELGPCAAHATINCLQCFDIDLEDLDEDGNLIVVDGQSVTNWHNELLNMQREDRGL